jgi:DinB superfamily
MSQVAALRMAYQTMHEFLENTAAGVTADQANWQPPGLAHTIGANYGHVVFGEDAVINAVVRGGAPLMATRFAGKTGASEPPPPGMEWADWASRVKIDLPALREYAREVYGSTDGYLTSISDADLDREIDMGSTGKFPLGRLLTIMMGNVAWHTGEIACLKGLQGAKGYPV